MQIERITISNFYGFEQREISFDPHFNLLVGENASGKTSLLKALSVAIGSWFLGIRGYQKSPGIDADEVRLAAQRYEDSFTFEKQFPARIECHGAVLGNQISWVRELRREGGRTTSVDAVPMTASAEDADRRVRSGERVDLPLICSYGTERLWFEKGHRVASSKAKQLPSRLDGYRDCFDFTIQESALKNWIREQETAAHALRRDPSALSVVRDSITQCVEGALSVYYDGRYGDLVVDTALPQGPQLFRNLSDGQRIVLTLVGDLARRAATLNPHMGAEAAHRTSGVVLIDELDLHLHPRWQRHVIRDLKRTFPALQFVVTTHSPQLIGEALPSEIRVLEDNRTTTPPRSFGVDSNRVLQELMGAPSRDESMANLLSDLFQAIEEENYADSERLLAQTEATLGPDDPEVTRARALMSFLELSR